MNAKRGQAQVAHARLAQLREARLEAVRRWTKSARRALGVDLALALPIPMLPSDPSEVLNLEEVSVRVGDRPLFGPLSLRLSRERLAIVGPNGSGKTTLLEIILGRRAPSSGMARRQLSKIGSIAQGASDWMLEESLAGYLERHAGSRDDVASLLVAHKFPLALAERPLRSLSAGERTRAALIGLLRRAPTVELIVLDEPTNGVDLLAQRALTHALRDWPGGLVVASHDRPFLEAIGIEESISLDPRRAP
ncbi:ABC transporter ATP-binding protein [Labilithrix luteola]|uniref:ABC transporter ATP-binding protein n=1 Tax=Labilithrix luteola TaxID=1391654 RepID=A0A0K1QA35_9BACT|nr:ABC transporter ATP-binding protein [Labilithrix luteola]